MKENEILELKELELAKRYNKSNIITNASSVVCGSLSLLIFYLCDAFQYLLIRILSIIALVSILGALILLILSIKRRKRYRKLEEEWKIVDIETKKTS